MEIQNGERPAKATGWLFINYCLIAGIATLLDMGVATITKVRLHFPVWLAAGTGYTLGMLVNFILNRYLNFASKGRTILRQARTFFGVAMIGLAINSLLMEFFYNLLGLVWLMSLIITKGTVMFWSFWGHNAMTFSGGFRAFIYQHLKKPSND